MNPASKKNEHEVLAIETNAVNSVPSFPGEDDLELAELVFDTMEDASAAGTRGGYIPARQLLYKAGSICVDMRVQPELGSHEIALTGQILDSLKPGHGLSGIPVSLLSKDGAVDNKTTNAEGEFYFGFRSLVHAQLVFGMGRRKTLVVPVPDATSEASLPEAGHSA